MFFLGVILSFGIDQSLNFTKKKKGTERDGYKEFRAQRLIETSLTNWRYKTFGDMKLWTKFERERERCKEEEEEEEEEEKVLWIHLTSLKLGVFFLVYLSLRVYKKVSWSSYVKVQNRTMMDTHDNLL